MRTSVFLFLAMSYTCFCYPDLSAQSQVEIVGHRGAAFTAPENTLASAKKAVELGADAFEIDIHMSKDKSLVVIHDSNTKRTTGVDLVVSEATCEQLKELDAGSFKSDEYKGEKIPMLEDILEYLPNEIKLYIEIKGPKEIVPVLKSTLGEFNSKISQIRIIAFDLETISLAKQHMPDIPCYYLKSIVPKTSVRKFINVLKNNNLDGADLHYLTINPKIVRMLKNENLACLAWTINSVDQAKKLINMGVEGITTDKPGLMRAEL
jgi:glycerophosphoryl diester phosphodiesterase